MSAALRALRRVKRSRDPGVRTAKSVRSEMRAWSLVAALTREGFWVD
jgi:hypothetical protein